MRFCLSRYSLATQDRKSNPRLPLKWSHGSTAVPSVLSTLWLPHPSGDDWDWGT